MLFFQNIRGGRVVLHPIKAPPSEYEHPEKGDALYGKFVARLFMSSCLNNDLFLTIPFGSLFC